MNPSNPLSELFDARLPAGLGGRWYGVFPALVTDIKDPDGQGRVKISLPWSPDAQGAACELWARLATLMGGKGFSGDQSGRAVYDLSALAGQVVDIRFQFASDYAAYQRGVRFDNMLVTGTMPSAVPEPATWAMMITGFGLAGTAIRSRRRRLAFG